MLEHRDHIADVAEAYPEMSVLWGCELNIGADGGLDYDADFRALFDYTVASVHSHYDQSVRDQTARLVAAIADPTVTSIGHLTGRYIGRRPGIEIDVDVVLEALFQFDKALEDQWSTTASRCRQRCGQKGRRPWGEAGDQHRQPSHFRTGSDGIRRADRPDEAGLLENSWSTHGPRSGSWRGSADPYQPTRWSDLPLSMAARASCTPCLTETSGTPTSQKLPPSVQV